MTGLQIVLVVALVALAIGVMTVVWIRRRRAGGVLFTGSTPAKGVRRHRP